MANVRDHAHADNAVVELAVQHGEITLTVHDDGVGFTPGRTSTAPGRGFGLPSLRERMRSCGGSLTIDSTPGRGTRVVAALPDVLSDSLPRFATATS